MGALVIPIPPQTGVDPLGIHHPIPSVRVFWGEVTRHHTTCHFTCCTFLSCYRSRKECMPLRIHTYGERDFAFGQVMLRLRTAIRLTQVELAQCLGVSRAAVLGWEAGSSYPKAERLKRFIALGVQLQAFPDGREEEEIRALWQAAHQKVLLDVPWLSNLLGERPPPLIPVPREPVERTSASELPGAQPAGDEWTGMMRWMCRVSTDARRNWAPFHSG